MRNRVRRLIRWMDSYTLLAFNPAQQFRQLTPRD
jgi:hypothetical protein